MKKADVYEPVDSVLVRYKPKRGSKLSAKKRFVVKRKIVKNSDKCDMYKVKFSP